MSNLANANKASEQLIDSVEWLGEQILGHASLSADDKAYLAVLVDHVVSETYRVAVLCALAQADTGTEGEQS